MKITIFIIFLFLSLFNSCQELNINKNNKIYNFIKLMPKIDLHVHLEGSIPYNTILELAKKNKINIPAQNTEELKAFFKFKDFQHFFDIYKLITSCIRTKEDYEKIAYDFGKSRAQENIKYSEVIFTIKSNLRANKLSEKDIINSLNSGKNKAEKEFNIKWGWVFDIVREDYKDQNKVLNLAIKNKKNGVISLSLTGTEQNYPVELFTKTFKKAKKEKLLVIPHTGEFGDPELIFKTIKLLNPDRIGHGVNSIKNQNLINYLREKQIPLEICITSNIKMGVFDSYENHPVKKLWDAGLFITINTDDPTFFDTSLEQEYKILVDKFNFSIKDLEKVNFNAIKASALSNKEKESLLKEFEQEYKKLTQANNL